MATATGEAEEDWEEDWEVGTEKVAEKVKETLLYSLSEASKVVLSRTNFEDFSKDCPKEDFKRFQLCGKERDKKEDTKRHCTSRKEHMDTVYT